MINRISVSYDILYYSLFVGPTRVAFTPQSSCVHTRRISIVFFVVFAAAFNGFLGQTLISVLRGSLTTRGPRINDNHTRTVGNFYRAAARDRALVRSRRHDPDFSSRARRRILKIIRKRFPFRLSRGDRPGHTKKKIKNPAETRAWE